MDALELQRRLYVPNFDVWQRLFNRHYHSDRTPTSRTVENGIIMPPLERSDQRGGGIFDSNFKLVDGYDTLYHEKRGADFDITANPNFDRAAIQHSDDEVIFGGGLTCHFGHFISECLSRMWYLLEHIDDQRKFVFLNLHGWKFARWALRFFDLLGLPEDRVVILDKPTQFRAVVVPEQAAYIKEDFTDKFILPYRRIAERIIPRGDVKKLFLTRSRDLRTKNHLSNLEYFEDFYRAHGFTVVAPEKLSLTEQIALITGADEIVTFLGTLTHWTLFCRPSASWTMLTRFDTFNTRQCLLLEAHPVDWYIVSTARNVFYAEQGAGVNLLGPTQHWQDFVRDHFQEEIDINQRIPPEIVDDYFSHWCKYFSLEQHLQQRIDSAKALYNRMSLLERQVASDRPLLCFETHIGHKGWLPTSLEGEVSGMLHKSWKVQAIKIYFLRPTINVYYSVYYRDSGWSNEVSNQQQAGTTGLDKPIYGLSVRVDEPSLEVQYRLHGFDGNWSPWAADGDKLTSKQMINAVELKVVAR